MAFMSAVSFFMMYVLLLSKWMSIVCAGLYGDPGISLRATAVPRTEYFFLCLVSDRYVLSPKAPENSDSLVNHRILRSHGSLRAKLPGVVADDS